MANKGRKKGDTGKRYSNTQKAKILKYVESKGRGGITAACQEFGVSYIALRRWLNGKGMGEGNRPGRPRKSNELDSKKMKSVEAAISSVKIIKNQMTELAKALRQLSL